MNNLSLSRRERDFLRQIKNIWPQGDLTGEMPTGDRVVFQYRRSGRVDCAVWSGRCWTYPCPDKVSDAAINRCIRRLEAAGYSIVTV